MHKGSKKPKLCREPSEAGTPPVFELIKLPLLMLYCL
jgi:hypothetical protein